MKERGLPKNVYHLAEATNWPSIRLSGLLPASQLIKNAGVPGAERRRLEMKQRPVHTTLGSGVQIRDQKPMPAKALQACLIGMTPAEWYALINARVFFWFDPDRLNRQRRACEARPQIVLTMNAPALVQAYGEFAALTPINTGNARRKPATRGGATFVPYDCWLKSGWMTEGKGLGTNQRKTAHKPVELTIAAAVRDVLNYVTAVQELSSGQIFNQIK